eukprot:537017-Prorocentrum_minimum.AAC.1
MASRECAADIEWTIADYTGSTRTCGVRKELVGELNFRVVRWLNKVLMVNSTVSVSSPTDANGGRLPGSVAVGRTGGVLSLYFLFHFCFIFRHNVTRETTIKRRTAIS